MLANGERNNVVIQLTLMNENGAALVASAAPFFRITGAAVWTVPGDGYIARLTQGGWESGGKLWAGMRFEGACRLVMGFARAPSSVSEILQSVSVSLEVLSANGIPFAAYNSARDMWRSAMADKWWHAFRIESLDHRPSLSADVTEELSAGRSPGSSQARSLVGRLN